MRRGRIQQIVVTSAELGLQEKFRDAGAQHKADDDKGERGANEDEAAFSENLKPDHEGELKGETTMTLGFTVIGAAFALYVLSAGLAFAGMYRWPTAFNGLVLSRVYSPLEAIARRSQTFRRIYAAFLHWCYWQFSPWRGTAAWEEIKNGNPPPKTRPPYPPPPPAMGR